MDEPHDAEHETLSEVEADLTDDFGDDGDDPLRQFVRGLRETDDADVRAVGQYDGEEYELLYLRSDLESRFDADARANRVKNLVMKALGEPVTDPVFEDYGELNAVVRWFDEAVIAIYPDDEWSGVFATFDRTSSPLVDLALKHLL
ncbi:hypothetical protein E6P09_02720 [Haloferax mediterranei ATCC 33500]|uniref:Uncharacterized protein n=1 Tax=Haloferax mediterranei (strain ATCC 33500 / DSM 1411 / JCM 8866 / NBRC 14739 / NCIMB 2177 / R-4) TaxID=523841 RepID=I3R8R2_HALMT|nr:hypothetical protein [Haloferax mediterranei]AFK20622.1 hypothetical protein HFX_2958 [Haloferax mediterranei ATCC 33500]AHZ22894.1 hypothetical protein BM92_09685 [Haloferax mediterranei ATCC 33500]EMA03059.1 hypothetical protein C439_10760 [Haloferax mediterranei ATCC 33500]MDX5987760.1 hypothetical protein [Haloferax mediterranei ATCC 33500]QCQ74239.1 hypothetical protein E6P09_02720 [Haloferax mediterranei ATCC 33500]